MIVGIIGALSGVGGATEDVISPPPTGFENSNIVITGNSLSDTVNFPNSVWPGYIMTKPALTTGADMTNVSQAGIDIQMMGIYAPTNIDPLFVPGKRNILIIWEVTNMLLVDKNARETTDRHWAYVAERQAEGWDEIYMITSLPRNINPASYGTVAYNADLALCAQYIVDEAAVNGVIPIDLRVDSRLNDATNGTYFYDGSHLSVAGSQIVGDLVYATLLENI